MLYYLIETLVFKKNKVILPSKITSLPKRCFRCIQLLSPRDVHKKQHFKQELGTENNQCIM